jgi:hypothetical protein
MNHPPAHSEPSSDRRSFISNTVKLAVLGSILAPLDACNNNKTLKKEPEPHAGSNKKSKNQKTSRKKWNHERLIMNSKTQVMHFPTSKVYTYYDEVLPKHLQEISLATWASQLQEPVRLNKGQSGNILEILAMQHLNKEIDIDSLATATDTLAKAFTQECDNSNGTNYNTTNFRLHELIVQLITLNSTIPPESKWGTFNSKVKKPGALRKRQKWMETETNFNERAKYILDRQNDYITRLKQRASKYSFT